MAKDIRTTIEITDTHIKLLQAKPVRGNVVVTACEVRTFQNFTDEEMVRFLNELTLSKNIPIQKLMVVIPRRLSILKQMKLPSVHEAEIKKIVGLQLVNQIPYNSEDVVFHDFILEKDPSGYTQVLVMVIHKEVIDRYLKIFHKVGLRPKQLTLSSLGLLEWLIYQEQKKVVDTSRPVVLLHIDTVHTEICFCHNRKLLFSRSINFGARDLNTDNLVSYLHQIELSLNAYRKESMGPAISKVIVISSLLEAVIFAEKVQKEFTLPAQVLSPFEKIVCQKNINLASFKNQVGLSFGVGLGLLQVEPSRMMNFLPKEIDATEKNRLRQRQWANFISLLVLSLACVAGIFGIDIYKKVVMLKNLEARGLEVKSQMRKADQIIDFVQFFNEELRSRILITDLMDELLNLIPEDVSIRTFELNEKGALTIQGYAQNGGSVNTLQSSLVRSPRFKEVNLEFATKRRIFNMELSDFKIICQLTGTDEKK